MEQEIGGERKKVYLGNRGKNIFKIIWFNID